MLSRCSHCDRPFIIADTAARPSCPHCGRAVDDAAARPAGVDAQPAERGASPPEPPSAVVAEGSRPHPPAPGRSDPPEKRPAPSGFRDGAPAWEQRERSLAARFFRTLADACLHPVAFYTHLSREGVRGITWFAYTCLLLGTAGQALWRIVMLPQAQAMLERANAGLSDEDVAAARAEQNPLVNALLDLLQSSDQLALQLARLEAELWVTLLLAPLTAFFTIHLLAGLVHFSVQSFRPPDQEPVAYDVTYRFLLYAFAPMIFGLVPTVGGLAGFFTFLLMLVAVRRLHRVRTLGLIAGVLFPILLLSWMWDEVALPRLAPPLASALGVTHEPAPAAGGEADAALAASAGDDTAEEELGGGEYPPMPAADRDHSVELFEEGEWLYSERTWDSSLGRLYLRQRVAKDAGMGGRLLVIEVTNQGDETIDHLFVEHELPAGALVHEDSAATRARVSLNGRALDDITVRSELHEAGASWSVPRLRAGAKVELTLRTTGAGARALFQTAPSLGRMVPSGAPDEPAP